MTALVCVQNAGRHSEVLAAEELTARAGFSSAIVRVAGFFTFGKPYRGIFSLERRAFTIFRPDIYRTYVMPRDYRTDASVMGGGGELDLMPPAVTIARRRDFDLTAIKFGIRLRYGYEFVDSVIVNEERYFITVEDFELFRGRLMGCHAWSAGPVMNLVFGPRDDSFNFLINIFASGGQVLGGKLSALTAVRSARLMIYEMAGFYGSEPFLAPAIAALGLRRLNSAHFRGYAFRFGLGPHFAWNRLFPLTLGINAIYAYTGLKLDRTVPLYGGTRRTAHHKIGGEISAGFFF